jgi:hypothetical protein
MNERMRERINYLFEEADGPCFSIVHFEYPMATQQRENFGVKGIAGLTHYLHNKGYVQYRYIFWLTGGEQKAKLSNAALR